MTKHQSISIVLPSLNEEKGLDIILPELKELYPTYEILVVDHGSSDSTVTV